MSSIAIDVDSVSKEYIIDGLGDYSRLTEAIAARFQRGRARSGLAPSADQTSAPGKRRFLALRDVSLQVHAGETLGIVGANGAGKSTLLKILSRITVPTRGRVGVRGRVGCLLEVGTGFHPELTGRENVFLNGAILGMPRREIRRRFDQIVDFAEVGEFLDMPVKRYSNGMLIRLGFSVAAHLDPDVLIVDEVLGVGDASFQKKSLGKANEFRASGRTVLMVSHNLPMIASFCSRAVLLRDGQLVADGDPRSVIDQHLAVNPTGGRGRWEAATAAAANGLIVQRVWVEDAAGRRPDSLRIDEPVRICIDYRLERARPQIFWQIVVGDETGQAVFKVCELLTEGHPAVSPGSHQCVCEIPPRILNERRYTLSLAAGIKPGAIDWSEEMLLSFAMVDAAPREIFAAVNWDAFPVRPAAHWSFTTK